MRPVTYSCALRRPLRRELVRRSQSRLCSSFVPRPSEQARMSVGVDSEESVGTPFRSLDPKLAVRAVAHSGGGITTSAPWLSAPFKDDDVNAKPSLEHSPQESSHSLTAASADTSTSSEASPSSLVSGFNLSHGPCNETQTFLETVQQQVEYARYQRNQSIQYPTHPDALVPTFQRLKRHQAMEVITPDADFPIFARHDAYVELPPSPAHPWVKNTPIGDHITHGDGQLGVVGTGDVGFDVRPVSEPLPKHWRGLRHCSVLHRPLPQRNGKVLQSAIVKNSFRLTGRGVFATRDIKRGTTIMIVQSTAQSVGVKGELLRLEDMCVDVLLACGSGDEEALTFLHEWILTGQPSSLLEHWPTSSTQRVLERIGGEEVLHNLELHPIHIARMAAVMDLNSLLVESFFAERKGMAYFPEVGFMNHSCVPNATYSVIPEHTFRDSDYYLDEAAGASAAEAPDDANDVGDSDHHQEGSAVDTVTELNERAHQARAETKVAPVAVPSTPGHVLSFGDPARSAIDLTEASAPTYLFCCRAERDIAAGEEILISYIPPGWSFDNRQYVLHDRYRFWCKCPKCAPVLESKYSRIPKLLVVLIGISLMLQAMVFNLRREKNAAEEFDYISSLPEAERLEELRARGYQPAWESDVSEESARDRPRRRAGQLGFMELMEQERLDKVYEMEGRGPMTRLGTEDPWAKRPR